MSGPLLKPTGVLYPPRSSREANVKKSGRIQPVYGRTLCVLIWALKSAPQLVTFWCIRVQFAAKVALSTTNAGVRKEAIGFPTNASFRAFLSGKSRRYLEDSVCMAEWWRQVRGGCSQSYRAALCRAGCRAAGMITTCALMQPISWPPRIEYPMLTLYLILVAVFSALHEFDWSQVASG